MPHESLIPAAADPEDPEKGEPGIAEEVAESSGAASQGSPPVASGAESIGFRSVCSGASSTLTGSSSESDTKGKEAPAEDESPPQYNQLTHYLTGDYLPLSRCLYTKPLVSGTEEAAAQYDLCS